MFGSKGLWEAGLVEGGGGNTGGRVVANTLGSMSSRGKRKPSVDVERREAREGAWDRDRQRASRENKRMELVVRRWLKEKRGRGCIP